MLRAISTLLSERFEGATPLLFKVDSDTNRLVANSETDSAELLEPHVAVGPAGGVIGRAASEAKFIVGSAASVPEVRWEVANESWCIAVPVLAPDSRVLAVIGLLGQGSQPSEQVLGVLEVTARLASMAASKEPVASGSNTSLDELTGLLDAESFWGVASTGVENAITFSTSISVLLVQISSPDITDALISRSGTIVASSVRPADSVAHLGAGRFAILLPDLRDTAEMSLVAEQITSRIERSPLPIQASVGAAIASKDANLDSLSEQASSALDLAETRGLQRTVIVEIGSGSPDKTHTMALMQMLRSGEVVPHYQPQIDLLTGETTGAEALARRRTNSGTEPIPILEKMSTSTITKDLTRHMLSSVCQDIAIWEANSVLSAGFKISVNATANELCDPTFLGTVTRAIEAAGIKSSRLCIEITESEAMANQGAAAGILRRLREFGVSIAVDDFGTGYSSLSYLARLPVDLIKIDRSFITDLENDRGNAAVIGAVVDVASKMEMTVLAEGIETQDQANILQGLGVNFAQGWLYSAALCPEDLIAFLARS